MQLSQAPYKITVPFANGASDKTYPIPITTVTAGQVSWTAGYPLLTRTPLSSGGIPPDGNNENGIFYTLSTIDQWSNAGAFYPYDPAFSSAVNGYPAGSIILNSETTGFWYNTTDNNTTNPESSGMGWVPFCPTGIMTVAMTSSNVTLTPVQASNNIIIISGTLTANLFLIFPNSTGQWMVINNTVGNFSITCKTASGTGVLVIKKNPIIIWGDSVNIYFGINRYSGYTSVIPLTASTILDDSYAGQLIGLYNPITITLPPSSILNLGNTFTFYSEFQCIINTVGSDRIILNSATSLSSITLFDGDTLELKSSGNSWVASGTAQLGYSSEFSSSLTSGGYQYLPSGFLKQWGISAPISIGGFVTVTPPIPFPNNFFTINATLIASTVGSGGVGASINNLNSFNIYNWSTSNLTSGVYFELTGY